MVGKAAILLEPSPLKTETERKDGLAWLGPACAPAAKPSQPSSGPSRDSSLKPCSTRVCGFRRKGSFCRNHCTDCPVQGPEHLWSGSRSFPADVHILEVIGQHSVMCCHHSILLFGWFCDSAPRPLQVKVKLSFPCFPGVSRAQ